MRVAYLFGIPVPNSLNGVTSRPNQISKALAARQVDVVWVTLDGRGSPQSFDGIPLRRIDTRAKGRLGDALRVVRFLLYCMTSRVDLVCWSDWGLWRHSGGRRAALQFCLRVLRIKNVQDDADPLVDFEIASGYVRAGTRRLRKMAWRERLSYRLADLVLLPTSAYGELYIRRGVEPGKILGLFHGVDPSLFNTRIDRQKARGQLGLDGKFVVGYISHLNPYRLIEEVIVPLVGSAKEAIPNAFFLLAGSGDLEQALALACSRNPEAAVLLDFLPYVEVPRYLAACDVVISPLNTRFEFARNAASMKIMESLMVGTPVVATRNRVSEMDFAGVTGVSWVGTSVAEFREAIVRIASDPNSSSIANLQAKELESFSSTRAAAIIAERIISLSA